MNQQKTAEWQQMKKSYDIDRALIRSILKVRKEDSHKGTYGRLLLTAGSYSYRGAAVIAALGAYYTGAGLVTVASEEEVIRAVASRVPEAVFINTASGNDEYITALKRADGCLIGCGLSRGKRAAELMDITLGSADCPLVIDADGLNILADKPELLSCVKREVILTPHIGEFSRLISIPVSDILQDREALAVNYATGNRIWLVLKSNKTLVITPDGTVFRNHIGNSGLAKAGSGDLLAGMVAALVVMGYTAADAALSGVYLHSLAADIAVGKRNLHSMTASYIAESISDAYNYIYYGNEGEEQ